MSKRKQPEIIIEPTGTQLQRIEPDNYQLQQNEIRQLPVVKSFPTAYQSAIKCFNKWLINEGKQVNIETIIDYLHEQQETKKASTIGTMKYGIKKALRHTMLMSANKVQIALIDEAFKDVKVGKANPRVYSHKLISEKELKVIYKKANKRSALIIQTLAETGMRISELISIKRKDCIVKGKYVYIEILGKGSKLREIFITKDLHDKINKTFNSNVYLFETKKKVKCLRNTLYRDVNQAGRVAGRDDLHPHMLRHYFATTMLLKRKHSLKAVSLFLGHADVAITSSVYIEDELTPDKLYGKK